MKAGILGTLALVNAVSLFFAFNPWIPDWRGPAAVVLAVEAASLVVIGIPLVCYHHFGQQKPLKQSLEDTLRTILDFLAGWA